MRIYLLKDLDGHILAAHIDKNVIRLQFFMSENAAEIWVLQTSEVMGIVESYRKLVSKGNGVLFT